MQTKEYRESLEGRATINAYRRKWARENRVKLQQKRRDKRRNLSAKAREGYGGVCQTCGSGSNLHLHHANGDGDEDRIQSSQELIYEWIIANNFPDTFNLLCDTCHTKLEYNKEK